MCTKINKIKQYLIEMKNVSPFRIGNGDDDGNGLLILDNRAVISGTTLAGLFRSFIIDDKKVKEDDIIYELLFKSEVKFTENGDEKSYRNISRIYFYDSESNETVNKKLICRNHVHIDKSLGTSADEHLFQEYHISQGLTFKFTFEVRGLEINENEYSKICNLLEEFISWVASGKLAIGSKSTFGFGIFKAQTETTLYVKEYDLTKEKDFKEYLSLERISQRNMEQVPLKDVEDKNIKIVFKGYCEDGLIIKGIKDIKYDDRRKDKPKKIEVSYKECIYGKEKFIIPSSTIKGVVVNHSKKMYKTFGKKIEEIEDIFGKKSGEDDGKGIKGKVMFKDCEIRDCKTDDNDLAMYNRIKIDRFTGGAMKGNLFTEKLVVIPKEKAVKFTAIANEEYKKAVALILIVFRDIGLGYITIGSGNNVGYGRFKGSSITIKKNNTEIWKIKFKNDNLEDDIEGSLNKFQEFINLIN